MHSAIFIGFGRPARARERQAIETFEQAIRFCSEVQQRGEIESFEPVLLEPHGGELAGFVLIRGSSDQLARLRDQEEFRRLTLRTTLVVENLGIVPAYVGDSLAAWMEQYRSQVEEQLGSP